MSQTLRPAKQSLLPLLKKFMTLINRCYSADRTRFMIENGICDMNRYTHAGQFCCNCAADVMQAPV